MSIIPDSSLSVQPSSNSIIQYIADNGTFDLTYDGDLQTFWLSQRLISEMFDLTQQAVSLHVQNFKKANKDIFDSVHKESLLAGSDGKNYNVAHYALDVVIYIGFRAQATEKTTRFQRWATQVIKDQMMSDVRQHLEATYSTDLRKALRNRDSRIRHGMPFDKAVVRTELAASYDTLSTHIDRITDRRSIGMITNVVYETLFGMDASSLKRLLGTDSIRDTLPAFQLRYLELGESAMNVMLDGETGDVEDVKRVAVMIFTPFSIQLKQICAFKKIHIVTGKPL